MSAFARHCMHADTAQAARKTIALLFMQFRLHGGKFSIIRDNLAALNPDFLDFRKRTGRV